MLKIKPKLHLSLPKLSFGQSYPMQLSPIKEDSDELTEDVKSDPIAHDNNWELNDRPDENELEAFWNRVEADVKKDPKWFSFDSE